MNTHVLHMSINLTLESLERLEHLEQLHRTKYIGVLGRDLDNNLEVLANVDAKHLLHTSHGLLGSKAAKVADKPLGKIHALKQARV